MNIALVVLLEGKSHRSFYNNIISLLFSTKPTHFKIQTRQYCFCLYFHNSNSVSGLTFQTINVEHVNAVAINKFLAAFKHFVYSFRVLSSATCKHQEMPAYRTACSPSPGNYFLYPIWIFRFSVGSGGLCLFLRNMLLWCQDVNCICTFNTTKLAFASCNFWSILCFSCCCFNCWPSSDVFNRVIFYSFSVILSSHFVTAAFADYFFLI